MYRLYVLENIRRGQEDAEKGKARLWNRCCVISNHGKVDRARHNPASPYSRLYRPGFAALCQVGVGCLGAQTFLLDELPRMGRKVPELGDEVVRELPLYSYHILYEIKTTHIDSLVVIQKRRDLQAEKFRESVGLLMRAISRNVGQRKDVTSWTCQVIA